MADDQTEESYAFVILGEDVVSASAAVDKDDNQSNRRALVRATVSAVEAMAHLYRSQLLLRIKADPTRYSTAEIALIREESYFLDGSGRPRIRPNYAPLPATFRFIIAMYHRGLWKQFDLDVDSHQWHAFHRVVELRHRLTHPKHPGSLQVSDRDLADTRAAYIWLLYTTEKALVDLIDEGRRREREAKSRGSRGG